MLVSLDDKQFIVTAGESIHIPKKTVHSFSVLSLLAAEIILEPASPGFEHALAILAGSEKDGLFQVGLLEDLNLVQMAVIAELTDSTYVGETGQMLLDFYNKTGEMIHDIKAEWLAKYIK